MQLLKKVVVLFWAHYLAADVFTVQRNNTPTFHTDARLQQLAQGLYDMYYRSGAQREGIKALLNTQLWEPWSSAQAKNILLSKEAIAHKLLTARRDAALECIIVISREFLQAVQKGKGDKAVLERVRVANAGLQEQLGAEFRNPCTERDSAPDCVTDGSLALQEQWSILKVYALMYPHFIRTMEPFLRGELTGWEAVRYFEESLITRNTKLFTSGLNVRESIPPTVDALYNFIMQHERVINSNVLFALPRMSANDRLSFEELLSKMQAFVGVDESRCARDARNLTIYWQLVMVSLVRSFDALRQLETCREGKDGSGRNTVQITLLPWGKGPFAPAVEPIFGIWLHNVSHEAAYIRVYSLIGHRICAYLNRLPYFSSLQQKYAVVLLMAQYLEVLVHKLESSLHDVHKLDALAASAHVAS